MPTSATHQSCQPARIRGIQAIILACYTHSKIQLFGLILLAVLASSISPLLIIIASYIFDHLENIEGKIDSLVYSLLILSIPPAFLVYYFFDLNIKSLNLHLRYNLLPTILNQILYADLRDILKYQSGTLVQKFSDFESSISGMLSIYISFITNFLSLLILLIFIYIYQPTFTFFILLISTLFLSFKCYFTPRILKQVSNQLAEQSKLTAFLTETLQSIAKIRTTRLNAVIQSKWLNYVCAIKQHYLTYKNLDIINWILEKLLLTGLMLFLYLLLLKEDPSANKTFYLQLILIVSQLTGLLERISIDITSIISLSPGLHGLDALLSNVHSEKAHAINYDNCNGDIHVCDLWYSHPETGKVLLKNISMSIQAGSFVGIIGPSGAGKSTLFRLLLGLLTPESGMILYDKFRLTDLDIRQVRKYSSAVLQTTSLFPGTIYSNIAIHNSLTLDQAWELAEQVGLSKDISLMPMKMYTHVADNAGESLSGGQIQKILIARALASRPKILLLDEATSALDNTSQQIIHDQLAAMNITRVAIAHRYSTIANADQIFDLKDGQLHNLGVAPCVAPG